MIIFLFTIFNYSFFYPYPLSLYFTTFAHIYFFPFFPTNSFILKGLATVILGVERKVHPHRKSVRYRSPAFGAGATFVRLLLFPFYLLLNF